MLRELFDRHLGSLEAVGNVAAADLEDAERQPEAAGAFLDRPGSLPPLSPVENSSR